MIENSRSSSMTSNVKAFLKIKILERNVIQLGDYLLNSGEKSNVYFNFGKFNDSKALTELGFIFWTTMKQLDYLPEVVFGCATKGIALALAASSYAWNFENHNLEFAYDRKIIKQHGEGGDYVGAYIQGKSVLIIDDVLTSGKAISRSIDIVKKYTNDIRLMVMLRRDPTVTEVMGYPVTAVLELEDIAKRSPSGIFYPNENF